MPESPEPVRVLIIVENLPVPFDRRVWLEATALRDHGYEVSVLCPTGKGHEARQETIDGVRVYRHPLPEESGGTRGYLREYATALWHEAKLSGHARRGRKFDVVHVCNPPDLLFLVAGWHKLFHGARVIFDHHDVNPELYEEKFGRRDAFYHGLRLVERATFATANVVIATNESYRQVALQRGGKRPEDVFVVRSAPDLAKFGLLPPDPALKRGHRYLIGYVGVMAEQDGVDNLLHALHRIRVHHGRGDVGAMLIGGGPSMVRLQELAADLDLTRHVEFAGFRTGDDLLQRLSTCDVCASPDPATRYNRMCTMNKVMEYMALGKASVQFDLDEGRVSAGEASLYARDVDDFADQLLALIDDPMRRERMGAIGRARMCNALQWRHQIPNLLAAYARARA